MTSTMRDFADWSMFPFRLMGQTMEMMTRIFGVQTGGSNSRYQDGNGQHSSQSTSTYQTRSAENTDQAEGSGSRWKGSSSASCSGDLKTLYANDLSGDDIKLVRSYVAFTKPGEEKISEERTELVTWETDEETYGGVIVGRYARENANIDDHDMRYLKPHIEVIDRWPREAEETETITRRVDIQHDKRI